MSMNKGLYTEADDGLAQEWHEWVMLSAFIRGRLTFGGAPNSAPFPSVIAAFLWAAVGGLYALTLRTLERHAWQ